MKSNDFLSNLLQVIGFLAAIIIALTQYFFSSNFKYLFNLSENYYSISNIVALILSLVIILGIYTIRHSLDIPRYFCKSSKEKYFKNLQEIGNDKDKIKTIQQPRTWALSQSGFVFIFIAIILYGLLLMAKNAIAISLFYISFICSSVYALSIFCLKIYNLQDYKNTEEKIRKQTLDKINE